MRLPSALRPFGIVLLASFLAQTLNDAPVVAAEKIADVSPSVASGDALIPGAAPRFLHRQLNHIYAFDEMPLGSRIPVILVPGRGEEYHYSYWWHHIRDTTDDDDFFRKNCKLYIFLYDSRRELDDQAADFETAIRTGFIQRPERRPPVLIAYSLGGNIARNALEKPDILAGIQHCIALSVPFHGSPFFTPDWFIVNFKPHNHSPLRRAMDHLLYRTYMFNKENLTRGLQWNNFDASGPIRGKVDIEDGHWVPREPSLGDPVITAAIKQKLTIYGSFLENPITQGERGLASPSSSHFLHTATKAPEEIIGLVLPSNFISEHGVFRYLNLTIANIPPVTRKQPLPPEWPKRPYRYNDGALPLSSQLYLPPRSAPYPGDLAGLIQAADTSRVRVLQNLDHVDMAEYHRREKYLKVKDMAHPELKAKTPNQWLMTDLHALILDAPPAKSFLTQ